MNQSIEIPFTDLYGQYEECQLEIDEAFHETVRKGDFLTGPTTERFEKKLVDYTGAEACASMASGSMALVCALRAIGIEPGDEVLTVGHTFCATTEAILAVGAEPIFVDIDEFYHMDVKELRSVTGHKDMVSPKLKAILFVDLYGQTPDIDKIKEFAKEFNLKVIEDAAQSFGSEYKGKKVGSLVDLTTFSFNPLKNLGAMGDAGAVTGKKQYIDKVKILRNHGRGENGCSWNIVGYNGRIDNLQASILEKKLVKVDSWIEGKRDVAHRYTEALRDIVVIPKETPWSKHTYYVYVIMVEDRDNLKRFLSSRGIETRIHYAKSTLANDIDVPKTRNVVDMVLSLPCYHNLPEHHQDKIINSIKEYYNEGEIKHGV
jgi:dTDP-4-amino-4,6-dideoxygalactose transaminase